MIYDVIIIGAGAAGLMCAIEALNRNRSVLIIEKSNKVGKKILISGGGRCNVTHGQFIPSELTINYPRGEKELLGPFHQFMTGDTMKWFEDRGIKLKIEQDGRVFPVSNNSQTIIDCFLSEVKRLNIKVLYNYSVKSISFICLLRSYTYFRVISINFGYGLPIFGGVLVWIVPLGKFSLSL